MNNSSTAGKVSSCWDVTAQPCSRGFRNLAALLEMGPVFLPGRCLSTERAQHTMALLALCLWQDTGVKPAFSTYSTWWFGLNAAKAAFWPFFEVKPCTKAGEPQQLKARTT